MKAKLKKENSELVSAANQLKLIAADGKKYLTDTFDNDGIIELAKNFPSKQANRFIEWFTNSDETIEMRQYPFMPADVEIVERLAGICIE